MERKVGIGFIGTGFARRVQIPGFSFCSDARLVSIASARKENAEATAGEFGIGHFTADWRETASHPDVDLVCITTPPVMHREMTLFALEHKKHILAEKPMAMNIAEALEMAAAAEGTGRLALIDHELRFLPGRQKAYAMLRDGAIGRIRHAKYNFRAPHRGDPKQPWDWWSDANSGGGALGAISSHIIDSFNWFLGTEASTVVCQLQSHIKERPYGHEMRRVTTDDEVLIIFRFHDSELTEDATGMVSISMLEGPGYTNRIEFFGTEGSIRIEHRGHVYISKNGDEDWTPVEVEIPPGIEGVLDSGFPSGFRAFAPKIIEAIAEGRTDIVNAATFNDGVKVQKVLDAARESDATGRRVEIAVAKAA